MFDHDKAFDWPVRVDLIGYSHVFQSRRHGKEIAKPGNGISTLYPCALAAIAT